MQVAKNQRQSRFAVRSTSLIREIGKSVFEKTRYHVTGPRLEMSRDSSICSLARIHRSNAIVKRV